MRWAYFLSVFIVVAILGGLGFVHQAFWWVLIGISPFILLGVYDVLQRRHTIRRNFPIVGNFRYLLEEIRPEIGQYFIESDINGRPFSRRQRNIVYQRAKKELDTVPFGTQLETRDEGYEFISHSIYPREFKSKDPRIKIGGKQCKLPYESSVLNISAMSFGSLSKNAITALNIGAREGNFAHNTGEGGISPYHLQGGDLIWQIGTGYFGCRDEDGRFDPDSFTKNASREEVKMIELKLSQGAKPGHGGILPGRKNTPEIAKIRKIEPWVDVISPPAHKEFDDEEGLLNFIQRLRELSGGKPVGFKLCLGHPQEFENLCLAMLKTKVFPDFITVDGSEGGTGAAPMEYTDSMGMPLYEGLSHIHDCLKKHGLRKEIKVVASGKVVSGFDMIKTLALGADVCNSARAMMMALGCIQALRCNADKCPTGVATQRRGLTRGLVVKDKWPRVKNFHRATVDVAVDIAESCGFEDFDSIGRQHILVREDREVRSYDDIYPIPVKAKEFQIDE